MGSTCTAISSTLAKSLNIEKGTDTVDIKYLNTQSSAITARDKLLISFGNRFCYCYPVIINNASKDIIIGQSELQKLRISFLFSPNKVEINAIECNQTSLKNRILTETPSVVSADSFDLGCCSISAPKMEFTQPNLNKNPRYDIQNPTVRGKCKQHVLEMISHNLASQYAPRFICNLRPVEKKSGDIRMTLDMRPVNEITVPIYYSSPKINFILHSMGTFDFISRLDLRNAYTQIPLDPADNRTIGGHIDGILFSQLRLPQGGRNSPAIFQYIIDQVLADTPSMAFQDDIWICTKGTASLHSDEVISTCKALAAHNLKISLDKSEFLSNETILLGHRITKKGTAIAPKFISTITNFPRPTNIYQLRKFRGIFNFCKRYIKDYSVHESVINKFISNTPKKDSKALVTISDSVLQSIDLIKQQVQNAYSLAHVQYDYPFILTVDSSLSGMGAVLLQPSTKIFDIQKPFAKVLHCVGLFSRQHHYKNIPPIVVVELKAISASLTFFGELIQGCPVHIYSDHKNLLSIIRESQDPKYDKYIYNILQYSPASINYLPGFQNELADTLSRHLPSLHGGENEINILEDDKENSTSEKIANITSDLFNNLHCKCNHISTNKVFAMANQVLTREFKKPKHLRKILKLLKLKIENCNICKEMNTLKRKQIPKSDEDVEPFQVLYTDVTFIEGCPIIAAIDKCSRYAIISVLKKATSSAIKDFFISKIFNVFGLPVRIHSDAGKNFQGSCFKEMCNDMKIEHTMAVVGEHCSNQIIVRFFRTLKLAINKQALEDKTTWRTTLEKVVFNYNNSPFSNSEVCPADIVFGFKVITLQMRLLNSTPSVQTEAKGYMQSIDQLKNLPKEVIVKVKDQNIKATPAKLLSNRNMLVSSTDDKRTDKIISLYKYRDAMIQNSNLSQL